MNANRPPDMPINSSRRSGVDHHSTLTGASGCVRGPYGTPHANAHAQQGADEPVMPSARARTASPEQHREGAALEEKHTNSSSAYAADALPLTVNSRTRTNRKPKRRRRDPDNPKTTELGFRCTEDVKAEVERRAAAVDMVVADYLERRALSDDGAGITTRDERLDAAIDAFDAMRRQVAGIARNLNQLTRDYNSEISLEPGEVLAAVVTARSLLGDARTFLTELDTASVHAAKAKRR